MPYVNIRIAGTLTREQKARIAVEITDTLERIALKQKSYTYIAFDELPGESWAVAGKLLDEDPLHLLRRAARRELGYWGTAAG